MTVEAAPIKYKLPRVTPELTATDLKVNAEHAISIYLKASHDQKERDKRAMALYDAIRVYRVRRYVDIRSA